MKSSRIPELYKLGFFGFAFIDGIYYAAIFERNEMNFAGTAGTSDEKLNKTVSKNSRKKTVE